MTARTEAVLARVCQQARDLPVPELDVAALESTVRARVERASVDSLVVTRRRRWFADHRVYVASAVIAAAAAIGLVVKASWHSAPQVVQSDGRGLLIRQPGLDGESLVLGQTIEAESRDLTISHRGIVTWRLSAASKARIVEQGERITVALEQGRIDAEVVPQSQPEVFAVEIEHVRVAVHGTVFAVERHGDAAEVVVSEGHVRLGTSDQRGSTQGEVLQAPRRKNLDVRTDPATAPAPSASVSPSKVRARHAAKLDPAAAKLDPAAASAASSSQEPMVADNLPEAPSSADIERLWDLINREVSLCFSEQPGGDPNVRVSFSTRISVLVAPDGSVTVSNFEPPLAEPVHQCIAQQIATLRTAPTRSGAFVRREKMLMR